MTGQILQYARLHGLAVDYRSNDPLCILRRAIQEIPLSNEQITQAGFDYSHVMLMLEERLNAEDAEKLSMSVNVARLLQRAIDLPNVDVLRGIGMASASTSAQLKNLKVQEPMLWLGGGNIRKDIARLRKSVDTMILLQTVKESLLPALHHPNCMLDNDLSAIEIHAQTLLHATAPERIQVKESVLQRLAQVQHVELPQHTYKTCLKNFNATSVPIELDEKDKVDDISTSYGHITEENGHSTSSNVSDMAPALCSTPATPEENTVLKTAGHTTNSSHDSQNEEEVFDEFLHWPSDSSSPVPQSCPPSFVETTIREAPNKAGQQDDFQFDTTRFTTTTNLHLPFPALRSIELPEEFHDTATFLSKYIANICDCKDALQEDMHFLDTFQSTAATTSAMEETIMTPKLNTKNISSVLNPPVSSETFLRKSSGLRLFDQTSYNCDKSELNMDSEDECAPIASERDLHTFLPQLRSPLVPKVSFRSSQAPNKLVKNVELSQHEMTQIPGLIAKRKASSDALPIFSATASLSTFLDLRGRKFKKPCSSLGDLGEEKGCDLIESSQAVPEPSSDNDSHCVTMVEQNQMEYVSLPVCVDLISPCTIVVNTELLQTQPSLTAFLEGQRTEGLIILYRDFNSSFEAVPHLIINPVTCILITNSQSLIQRSLPGQSCTTNTSLLHQSIRRLALSFQKIFVLISHHMQSLQGPSELKSQSFTQFEQFCVQLSIGMGDLHIKPIQMQYMNTKDLPNTLNVHIWSLITHESYEPKSITPMNHLTSTTDTSIQDETPDELFLRRAGLNCMAAQAVLSTLADQTAPFESPLSSLSTSPLASSSSRQIHKPIISKPRTLSQFLAMTPHERLNMFSATWEPGS